MKGDLHPCAVRLMSQLPVRTHERAYSSHVQGSKVSKSITIDGRIYDSILAAKNALHIGTNTIDKWLAEGRAKRV